MAENKRGTEKVRREAALEHAADVEEVVGPVPAREMRTMLSVRLEAGLVRGLREVAKDQGVSVSDLLRDAVSRLVDEHRRSRVKLRMNFIEAPDQWMRFAENITVHPSGNHSLRSPLSSSGPSSVERGDLNVDQVV